MWALTEKMLASRDILAAICTHNRKLNSIVSTYGHGKVYELTTAHNVTAGHTEFIPIEGTALDQNYFLDSFFRLLEAKKLALQDQLDL